MKTACVALPLRCPRSKKDAVLLIEFLRSNHLDITSDIRKADLIFVGTCGVNSFEEEKSFEYLSIVYKKKKKNARLIVYGCLPGISFERIVKNFDVYIIEYQYLHKIEELINAKCKLSEILEPITEEHLEAKLLNLSSPFNSIYLKFKSFYKFPRRTFSRILVGRGPNHLYQNYKKVLDLRISTGCSGNCTFCGIKLAAGCHISKPLEKVLSEFKFGLQQGYKVFRLIACDVGSYGQDLEINICQLLEELFKNREEFTLVWDEFNPKWLITYYFRLSQIFKEYSNKIGYGGFPVQSGSERIIRLMKRGYTVQDVKKCLTEIRRVTPRMKLTTHVLIGFPTEKIEDFEATLNFLKTIRFEQFLIHKYDDRPGIEASLMQEKVKESLKHKRIRHLRREFRENGIIC
jgi:tRNA-2-methylthio-N6-dimethylallyladenosine synthase